MWYLSYCVLIGQSRWLTAMVIAGQKRRGRERKKIWYRRRESEKRVKVIYATCHCKLNVFLAWCFRSKKLKIKSILKICFQDGNESWFMGLLWAVQKMNGHKFANFIQSEGGWWGKITIWWNKWALQVDHSIMKVLLFGENYGGRLDSNIDQNRQIIPI